MSTGTIQPEAVKVIYKEGKASINTTFLNSSGVALKAGDEVFLYRTGILKRQLSTQIPLGIVVVGGEDGEDVVVATYFAAQLAVVNKTGDEVFPAAFLSPKGITNANGYPEYEYAATGGYSNAIVIKGGAADAIIYIGIFQSAYVVNF